MKGLLGVTLRRPAHPALAVNALALALGAGWCLAAWYRGHPAATGLRSDWIPVAPNTALGLLVLALQLGLDPGDLLAARLRRLLSGAVLTVALLRLGELLGGWALQTDSWFFPLSADSLGAVPVGAMALPTALGFAFLGFGLLCSSWVTSRAATRAVFLSGSMSLGLGLAFLLGYLYGAPLLYGGFTIPMAFLTALGMVSASLGLIGEAADRLVRERQRHDEQLAHLHYELALSVQDLSSLASGNRDGLLVGSSAGEILYANLAVRELLGAPDEVPSFLLGAERGQPVRVVQAEKVLEVRCESTHWRGQPATLYCLRDVSAPYRAERELAAHRQQLEVSQRLEVVGRLASSVAHDFNNILTAILGYAELMRQEGGLGENHRRYLDEISRSSEKATKLTRELLSYSRPSAGVLKACDLNALVEGAVGLLEPLLGRRARLRLELSPQPQVVLADPSRLEQVLLNLVLNARDASPPGEEIVVCVGDGDGDCFLEVVDRGEGIPAEHRERVMEPFFTTKPRGMGTGLGLPICQAIVQEHHGQLSFDSAPEGGTTFRVRLPRSTQSVEVETPVETPHGGTGVVLVVDDEESLRRLLSSVLQRYGFTVRLAATPDEAVQIWQEGKGPIDLLLTDLNFREGPSGAELAQRFLRERRGGRVLLMSGTSPPDDDKVLFLQKPFTPSVLVSTVRDAIQSAASQ